MNTGEGHNLEKLLLRPEEAAEILGIRRTKLYEMLRRNEVPKVIVGHSIRVPVEALRRWIAERTEA